MRHLLLPALAAALILSGCATILSGTTETVHFSSSPSGAQVYANGNFICTTPCSAELKKKEDYSIELRLDGYTSGRTRLVSSTGGGWILLDVFLGGVVGIVVDAVTGAWNSFDQNDVRTRFAKAAAPR